MQNLKPNSDLVKHVFHIQECSSCLRNLFLISLLRLINIDRFLDENYCFYSLSLLCWAAGYYNHVRLHIEYTRINFTTAR